MKFTVLLFIGLFLAFHEIYNSFMQLFISNKTFTNSCTDFQICPPPQPYQFSPVISANLGISPRNFMTFKISNFKAIHKTSRRHLVPVSNHWTWTKNTFQKSVFFWSNPYKIEVVITSLIEMLELPNFADMTRSTI